jgi:hypothetical protein
MLQLIGTADGIAAFDLDGVAVGELSTREFVERPGEEGATQWIVSGDETVSLAARATFGLPKPGGTGSNPVGRVELTPVLAVGCEEVVGAKAWVPKNP